MSKSKNERGKTPSTLSHNTPVIAQNSIVPGGRFTDADWHELVENENTDHFICDLSREICDKACQKIFENTITSRVRPYAVFSAKQKILDIINWRFYDCDKHDADIENDPSWNEDEEAVPCKIESWAQGAVPITKEDPSPTPQHEVDSANSGIPHATTEVEEEIASDNGEDKQLVHPDVKEESEECEVTNDDSYAMIEGDKSQLTEVQHHFDIEPESSNLSFSFTDESLIVQMPSTDLSEKTLPQPPKTRKTFSPTKKFGHYRPSVPSMVRHHNNREGKSPHLHLSHRDKKNMQLLEKIDLLKLPTYRIKPKYQVLEAVNTDKLLQRRIKSVYHQQTKIPSTAALPPPLVEIIDVVEGVTVKEGDLVRSGPIPKEMLRKENALRPMNSLPRKLIDIADLV